MTSWVHSTASVFVQAKQCCNCSNCWSLWSDVSKWSGRVVVEKKGLHSQNHCFNPSIVVDARRAQPWYEQGTWNRDSDRERTSAAAELLLSETDMTVPTDIEKWNMTTRAGCCQGNTVPQKTVRLLGHASLWKPKNGAGDLGGFLTSRTSSLCNQQWLGNENIQLHWDSNYFVRLLLLHECPLPQHRTLELCEERVSWLAGTNAGAMDCKLRQSWMLGTGFGE